MNNSSLMYINKGISLDNHHQNLKTKSCGIIKDFYVLNPSGNKKRCQQFKAVSAHNRLDKLPKTFAIA